MYYPKEKKATDKAPESAPLLPRGYSFSEVTEQCPRIVRKVSSTPRLRGDEFLCGGNRPTVQTSSSPASSVGSAETPQEDYCQPPPKLEGIILGSFDLSLTRKGTCGRRGRGKLVVPERKVSSAQGSIEIDICGSRTTVTPQRTPSDNNTEVSLPGQNLILSSQLQLPILPSTSVESKQRSQSQSTSPLNSPCSRARSISRARCAINHRRNLAMSNTARAPEAISLVHPSIHLHHGQYMASETSPDQGSNVLEQPEPAIDSSGMVPQAVPVARTPQDEILSQLKVLSENVAGIKIEQIKINKHLDDTNSHLRALSEEFQLENDAWFKSLADYEKSINNHITQVVGTLFETVESVAVTAANVSDKTANIGFGNSKTSEGDELKWSDAAEQEAHETSAAAHIATYETPFVQGDAGPSTVLSTGGRRSSDFKQENVGSPVGRGRSKTNPSTTQDTSREQGQQLLGGWRGQPTTQKRGYWNHKRHGGGMSRRGSASGGGNRKGATPTSTEQHPPMPGAPQAQEVASPDSYAHSHMHGGYEDQSYTHPAGCALGPSPGYGQGSVQHGGFPPRQSSMRHNNTFMRRGAGLSNRKYMPQRDFTPNYWTPQQMGQGQSQPRHLHFQAAQNVGNTPPVGQWSVSNPEFTAYRPWAGVSNWYHQVSPQGNKNTRVRQIKYQML